jgi:predicted TIM-barrel fold metal-dependent hydrolase
MSLDIVDAQVHVGPGRIEETLAAMDALGVRGVVIDEYWMGSPNGDPGYPVGDGAFRPVQPTAELAALTHPERFSYLVRLDRRDPGLQAVVLLAGEAPHARALRITPGMWPGEVEAFARGEYGAACAAACDAGLPLFVFAPGRPQDVAEYARRFPELRLVVDHCGLMTPSMRKWMLPDAPPLSREQQLAAFDEVLALAELPNVGLKWGHAPGMFSAPGYPGEGLWPQLRKALDRFGPERVMWASDVTANQTGESWGELLFGVLGDPDLSAGEREAVLGGTVRAWLKWPL